MFAEKRFEITFVPEANTVRLRAEFKVTPETRAKENRNVINRHAGFLGMAARRYTRLKSDSPGPRTEKEKKTAER